MYTKHYLLLAIAGTITLLMGMQSTAFSSGQLPEKENNSESDALVVCPEPRPQMCTMDYRPVCAELKDGSFKTFANGCTSCTDLEVVGYRAGECKEGK